jgi:hypothetical protein
MACAAIAERRERSAASYQLGVEIGWSGGKRIDTGMKGIGEETGGKNHDGGYGCEKDLQRPHSLTALPSVPHLRDVAPCQTPTSRRGSRNCEEMPG